MPQPEFTVKVTKFTTVDIKTALVSPLYKQNLTDFLNVCYNYDIPPNAEISIETTQFGEISLSVTKVTDVKESNS